MRLKKLISSLLVMIVLLQSTSITSLATDWGDNAAGGGNTGNITGQGTDWLNCE